MRTISQLVVTVAAAVTLGAFALDARGTPPPAAVETTTLQEGFSFGLKDLQVPQQGGNTLNVSVRYSYKTGIRNDEYPDFRLLARACEDFLRDYPDKKAFWEVLNKDLTVAVMEQFPALASITVEIQVSPTSAIPYPRSSTVTRRHDPR